ncbi:nuclease-related domain-containing protein [Bhargavaea ullalensis]|uniref:NERD domain-containing protein n=1 Tax=Bhargavaea ullalensis TaxID=1265685 RepID=A0ABV2GE68_9BACL
MAKLIVYCNERIITRFKGTAAKRKELEKQLHNRKAGLAGEEKLLRTILSTGLPAGSEVLWDVSLPLPFGALIQLDAIVLLPAGVFVFEAKQIGGRLRFTQGPAELQKWENGIIVQSVDCPAAQFQDQQESLEVWLGLQQKQAKVGGSVVLTANPTVEYIPSGLPVIRLRELRSLLRSYQRQPSIWTSDNIQNLADAIRQQHLPFLPFPFCDFVQVPREDIFWGPICTCSTALDRVSERLWDCLVCGPSSQVPYATTLLDWFLLGGRVIYPRQFRELFQLSSSSSSHRILTSLGLTQVGQGRTTCYVLDYSNVFYFIRQLSLLFPDSRLPSSSAGLVSGESND